MEREIDSKRGGKRRWEGDGKGDEREREMERGRRGKER